MDSYTVGSYTGDMPLRKFTERRREGNKEGTGRGGGQGSEGNRETEGEGEREEKNSTDSGFVGKILHPRCNSGFCAMLLLYALLFRAVHSGYRILWFAKMAVMHGVHGKPLDWHVEAYVGDSQN